MRRLIALLGMMWILPAQGADWTAEVEAFCLKNGERCEELRALKPIPTRAGHYRFVGPDLDSMEANLVFLQRFVEGRDEPSVRAALVPGFASLLRNRPGLAVSLFQAEGNEGARAWLLGMMKDAEPSLAQDVLVLGLRDASPQVRESAAVVVGYHGNSTHWGPALEGLLTDADPRVRAMGARSLGWIGAKTSFLSLVPILSDRDANVRLQVLSALNRLDAARVRGLPDVQRLRADADPRVSAMAKRLAP